MTVSTRITAPNYKIFEPDALDAIYAKGNLDPIMGGISYAFGNAHKAEGVNNQQDYMQSQDKFNRMAAGLDAMEIDQKRKEAAMKIAGTLIGHGEDPTKLQGGADIYTNPGDNLLPGMLRNKIASEINKNNSGASADRSKDSDTVKETYVEPGSNKVVEVTHKGKPGSVQIPSGPGVNPKGSTPIAPNANSGGNLQEQISIRAKAAAGPDAKLIQEANGATLWKGSKGIVTFDPTGKQVRQYVWLIM